MCLHIQSAQKRHGHRDFRTAPRPFQLSVFVGRLDKVRWMYTDYWVGIFQPFEGLATSRRSGSKCFFLVFVHKVKQVCSRRTSQVAGRRERRFLERAELDVFQTEETNSGCYRVRTEGVGPTLGVSIDSGAFTFTS